MQSAGAFNLRRCASCDARRRIEAYDAICREVADEEAPIHGGGDADRPLEHRRAAERGADRVSNLAARTESVQAMIEGIRRPQQPFSPREIRLAVEFLPARHDELPDERT